MEPGNFSAKRLVLYAAAISAVEGALILLRIIPPVLSYSPANLLFALIYAALLAYGGWKASPSLVSAAKAGALISLGRIAVVIVAAIIGSQIHVPVMGMGLPPGFSIVTLNMLIILENTAVGAAVAVAFALIAGFLKKK